SGWSGLTRAHRSTLLGAPSDQDKTVRPQRFDPILRVEIAPRWRLPILPARRVASAQVVRHRARGRDRAHLSAARPHGQLAARPARFAAQPAQPVALSLTGMWLFHDPRDE